MKIYQILQGVDNPSAGPTYSVGALAHHLAMQHNQVSVVALGVHPDAWPHDVSLKIFSGPALKLGLAPYEACRFVREEMIKTPAVLHGHGVWRIANLFPLLLKKNHPVRLVWSPRGMFSEWSWRYRAWRKQPFWYLLQKPALNRVHCFHATADSEVSDIRRVGLRQPVAVIPNGVDIPPLDKHHPKTKTVVFLSRIHPKKGVHLLVDVWGRIAGQFPDWELVIAGKVDSPYGHKIEAEVKTNGVSRVHFAGEVLGEKKTQLLAGASLFVLPTYSENFGIAIAEALAHATPVVTTVETPWTALEDRTCGWCIKPDAMELQAVLLKVLALPQSHLDTMGRNGREWMMESFSWSRAAGVMQELYSWLLNGGVQPKFVFR